ncbi:MAG: ABC transporter permease [Anaerovoracaceae bacterium]|jgi:ABC-2 type transport system permease protein
MPVFKGYLKIIEKNLGFTISYFVIFLIICIMIVLMIPGKQTESFSAERQQITVIDNDESAISKALIEYLSINNDVTEGKMDKAELTRQLYARSTEYILQIPEGYGANFADGDVALDTTKVPGSAAGYYLDATINNFVRTASAFVKSGYTQEEAADRTIEAADTKADVTIVDTGKRDENSKPFYSYTFTYFPYLYLMLMITVISTVMISFSNREIRSRMLASPVSSVSQTIQAAAAFCIQFVILWLVTLLMPLVARGADFYTSSLAGYYVINSLCLLVVSSAIGFLTGSLITKPVAVAAVANIVALGMCFLCGAFVPMEYMGSSVKSVAKFLPVYWYEIANNTLAENQSLSAANHNLVFQCYAIQLAFAAAIFVVTLFIVKKRNQEA